MSGNLKNRGLSRFLTRILRWRPGGYLRASGALFVWLMVRATTQAATVLLLARWLGAEGYGLFVAVLAIAGFFTPVAGLGLGSLLLIDGARQPQSLPERLGMALMLWWPVALLLSLAATGAILWAAPSSLPLSLLGLFALGEIVPTSFVELAGRAAQSQQRVRTFGVLLAGLAIVRLTALLTYAAIATSPAVTGWLWAYALSGLGYAGFVMLWLIHTYRPPWPPTRDWGLVKQGLPFTVGALSYRIQAEFNKPVLAQAGLAQAGNFSIAQRIVDLASLPLAALQEALWPRVFASDEPRKRLLKTGSVLIAAALLMGAALFLAASLLPILLGNGYEQAVEGLRWLAWLPAAQTLRNLGNGWLIQAGLRERLIVVYVVAAGSGVLLTLLFAPHWGVFGAMLALYASEGLAIIVQMQLHSRFNRRR